MMIQTQAWSRLNQEPSAEPAGHSKKVWMGKAGVLIIKNEEECKEKDENEEKQPLIKLSSSIVEEVFSYLHAS